MNLASRPGSEFNKYEALELVDTLKNAAHDVADAKSNYYRIVYETLRDKLNESADYFHALLLSLLGDKDHEKVLDRMGKVEKRYSQKSERAMPAGRRAARRGPEGSYEPTCHYCHKPGHFRAQCHQRKRDQQGQPYRGNYGKTETK